MTIEATETRIKTLRYAAITARGRTLRYEIQAATVGLTDYDRGAIKALHSLANEFELEADSLLEALNARAR